MGDDCLTGSEVVVLMICSALCSLACCRQPFCGPCLWRALAGPQQQQPISAFIIYSKKKANPARARKDEAGKSTESHDFSFFFFCLACKRENRWVRLEVLALFGFGPCAQPAQRRRRSAAGLSMPVCKKTAFWNCANGVMGRHCVLGLFCVAWRCRESRPMWRRQTQNRNSNRKKKRKTPNGRRQKAAKVLSFVLQKRPITQKQRKERFFEREKEHGPRSQKGPDRRASVC